MPAKRNYGFTFLELLIALSIIAILCTIAYPSYTNHLVRIRRVQAEVALSNLAARLEQYYEDNNSYQGAALDELGVKEFTPGNFYRLQIDAVRDDAFQISAIPSTLQTKEDHFCGILMLNQNGEKQIKGSGSVDECWR